MGLSMHDKRALADIERSLSEQDPYLADRLATFGKRSRRWGGWWRALRTLLGRPPASPGP